MTESEWIRRFHKRSLDPRIDFWKINDRYSPGFPDVLYYADKASCLWIEYKHFNEFPNTINLTHKLTAQQRLRLKRLIQRGHNAHIAIASNQQGILLLHNPEWDQKITDFTPKLIDETQLNAFILENLEIE